MKKFAIPAVVTVLVAGAVSVIVWSAAGPNWAAVTIPATAAVAYLVIQYLGVTYRDWNVLNEAEPNNVAIRIAMEVVAMAGHAVSIGKSPSVLTLSTAHRFEADVFRWLDDRANARQLTDEQLEQLRTAHAELVSLVAPATPQSLRYIRFKRDNLLVPYFGQIQLIRQMMAVAVASLIIVVVFIRKTDFSGAEVLGNQAAANTAVLLAASALGGAFYALSTANRYVHRRSFDPALTPSYWSRFVLGLAAGTVLAVVLPVSGADTTEDGVSASSFTVPVLALLGGYSAEAVRQILDRFVDALKSLVGRRLDDEVDVARQQSVNAAQQAELRQKAAMLKSIAALEVQLGTALSEPARNTLNALYEALDIEAPETATVDEVGDPEIAPPEG